ncbi:MAG: site-specific integrase [Aureliella sp.]
MPRLSPGAVPKLRKHKASNLGVVTLNGRDHYLGPWGTGKKPTKAVQSAYDAKISAWLSVGRFEGSPAGAQLSMAQVLASYIHHAKGYYTPEDPNSKYHDMLRAARKLRPYIQMPANDFKPQYFKEVRSAMVSEGCSRTYVNQVMGRVLKIIKWAYAEGHVDGDVYHRCKAVEPLRKGFTRAPETEGVKPVEASIVQQTIPHLPPVIQTMVKLHMLLGCRPAELCGMRAGMVDQSEEVWTIRLENHKNAFRGKDRVLYLGPRAQKLIDPLLDRGDEDFLFSPQDSERQRLASVHAKRSTRISCGNRPGYNSRTRSSKPKKRSRPAGDRYLPTSYARAIKRACAKHGIPHWHPSQIRHTVATAIRRDHGLEAVAVSLGHSEVATSQIYAEKDESLAIKIAREMG